MFEKKVYFKFSSKMIYNNRCVSIELLWNLIQYISGESPFPWENNSSIFVKRVYLKLPSKMIIVMDVKWEKCSWNQVSYGRSIFKCLKIEYTVKPVCWGHPRENGHSKQVPQKTGGPSVQVCQHFFLEGDTIHSHCRLVVFIERWPRRLVRLN